jgi:hypothetical protein
MHYSGMVTGTKSWKTALQGTKCNAQNLKLSLTKVLAGHLFWPIPSAKADGI